MANIQLVVFELNGEEYGIDALSVNGILRHQKFQIHKVPGLPDFIEGMIDLRGQINYIFNLGVKFGSTKTLLTEDSKFVMFNIRDAIAGCIVDEVTDIVMLTDEDIQVPPVFMSNLNAKYLKGIGRMENRMIIILNPELILSTEEYELVEKRIEAQ
ncbi:MAG TPA: chemotaxis protein CheW [Negativicutes bacterium]|nr:chemotaxis protein CheW [Negativicutes bacterium]